MLSAVAQDPPDVSISALSPPSGASPTEWFGVTTDGQAVRVRYRYGYLSVAILDPAAEPREVFGKQVGGPLDGVLGDGAMRGHLAGAVSFAATVDDHPIPSR
jgi:hypothetical protein